MRNRSFKYAPRVITCACLLLVFVCCSSSNDSDPAPRLVVVITVDQMCQDFFTRFESDFIGGLKRLYDSGAVFTRAYHDHAYTLTGPGHATLATGCTPSAHGIVGNSYYDHVEKRRVYCCLDDSSRIIGDTSLSGRSPDRMLRPSFGELLRRENPQSQVISLALKDRSAITTAGHDANGVYWFNTKTGEFVTSNYYENSLPQWLIEFNASGYCDQFFETGWTQFAADSVYNDSRADEYYHEADGVNTTFPHLYTDKSTEPDAEYYDELTDTPFGDLILIECAKRAISTNSLGSDENPDVLMLNLSAADHVGHGFGPYSREVQDYFLRLDVWLADFMIYLDSTIGGGYYIIALSSDHGVLPLPEYLKEQGVNAYRIHNDTVRAGINRAISASAKTLDIPDSVMRMDWDGVVINYDLAITLGVDSTAIENVIAKQLRKESFVEDVFTREELARMSENSVEVSARRFAQQYLNMCHPTRGVDVMIHYPEFTFIDDSEFGTTHGTPFEYDTHVPLVFYGSGFIANQIDDSVRTVDLAPTLYEILNLDGKAQFSGRSLVQSISK